MVSPTPWDKRATGATALLGSALFVVVCLVTAATDEGGVAWAARVGRSLPLVPLCGATATFLAMRAAERRGETLALDALGCAPGRVALGAVVGGVAASVLAVLGLLALPSKSARAAFGAFFPHVGAMHMQIEPGPIFVDAVHGARITALGVVSSTPAVASSFDTPTYGRVAVALVVLAIGCALPMLTARAARDRRALPVFVSAVICVLCIFFFHASAAGRISPLFALLPASALLVLAGLRYGRASWV